MLLIYIACVILLILIIIYYILRKWRPVIPYHDESPLGINKINPPLPLKNYISIYENEDCTGKQVNVRPGVYSIGRGYANSQRLPIKENWGKCIKQHGGLEYMLYDGGDFKTTVNGYGAGGESPKTKTFSHPFVSSISVFPYRTDNPVWAMLQENKIK